MLKKNTKSILVLESDELFRETLLEILKLEGYNVHYAKNGYLGLELAKEQLPDLILCASAFSDISCWEVFQELRRLKTTRHIRFICLSSRPINDECKDLPEKVSVLTKPFSSKELIGLIQSSLFPSPPIQVLAKY